MPVLGVELSEDVARGSPWFQIVARAVATAVGRQSSGNERASFWLSMPEASAVGAVETDQRNACRRVQPTRGLADGFQPMDRAGSRPADFSVGVD
jgi:hypothetical protein